MILRDAGHLPMWDDPRQVAELLLSVDLNSSPSGLSRSVARPLRAVISPGSGSGSRANRRPGSGSSTPSRSAAASTSGFHAVTTQAIALPFDAKG